MGVVIAGHAEDPGTPVYQPSVAHNNYIGDVVVRSPRPVANSDAGFVRYGNMGSYVYSENSYTYYDYVVGVKRRGELKKNERVNIQGFVSCGTSGFIIGLEPFIWLYDDVKREWYCVNNVIKANYTAVKGDSSSPVYQIVRIIGPDHPRSVVILGNHIDGKPDEYFGPIDGIERDLGIRVLT